MNEYIPDITIIKNESITIIKNESTTEPKKPEQSQSNKGHCSFTLSNGETHSLTDYTEEQFREVLFPAILENLRKN